MKSLLLATETVQGNIMAASLIGAACCLAIVGLGVYAVFFKPEERKSQKVIYFIVGLLSILSIVLMIVSANKYQAFISTEGNSVDVPGWISILYIGIEVAIATAYLAYSTRKK